MDNLAYDESFVLHYSLPWYFYFNKHSTEAIQRLQEGFAIAAQDGSLKKIFLQQQKENIDFAQLKNRRVFNLTTPFDDQLSKNYHHFLIDPTKIDATKVD